MQKQIFSAVLISAALAFTACQKSEEGAPVASFKAFSEVSTSAKTHLEPDVASHAFRVKWDEGDQIKVYNSAGRYATYRTSQGDVESATFTADDGEGVDMSRTYIAFYPATLSTRYNSGSPKVTLPAQQPYQAVQQDDDGGYYGYVTGFPMAAKSTWGSADYNSNTLCFKNLCGLCVLRLKGREGVTVNSITLSEPTFPYTTATALSGSFFVNWGTNGLPTLSKDATASGQEVVNLYGCNVALDDDNYHLFYFYLPEGDHKWLNVTVDYTRESSWSHMSFQHTVTRTILASDYNSATNISFDRSRWTALDVDMSWLIYHDHFLHGGCEDYSPIYSADYLTFGPNSDNEPILNTNCFLNDDSRSYTIFIDATPSVLNSNEVGAIPRYYTLFNYADASGKGIVIRYCKTYNHRLAINVYGPNVNIEDVSNSGDGLMLYDSDSDGGFNVAAGVRNRIVVVIDVDSNTYHLYANTTPTDGDARNSEISHVSGSISGDGWQPDILASYVRSVIGGDQSDVTGGNTEVNQFKHNFQGTIHRIRIFDHVLIGGEVEEYLKYGSSHNM